LIDGFNVMVAFSVIQQWMGVDHVQSSVGISA